MNLHLVQGTRLVRSPYFDCTLAAGAKSFSVYNHMLLPMSYGDPDAEYWRLINDVTMWDVAAQVQVELSGPDAAHLAQALVCRDLSSVVIGQAKYAPMVDHQGRLINDPVILKVDPQRWWLSLADSDMVFWCRAIAAERGLNAAVSLPDVSPLAVQGPKAVDVISDLFGGWVRNLGRFRFRRTELADIPLWLGRSGWSKQGGYELYLLDSTRGSELWNLVAEAGEPYNIGPGAPNTTERIESFLLSYRGDTPDDADPFECRLEAFIDLDSGVDFVGREALLAKRANGLSRQLVGMWIDGDPITPPEHTWPVLAADARSVVPADTRPVLASDARPVVPARTQSVPHTQLVSARTQPMPQPQPKDILQSPRQRTRQSEVGEVRAATFSPRLGRNIALALIDVPHNQTGTAVVIDHPTGRREGITVDLPFCPPGPAA